MYIEYKTLTQTVYLYCTIFFIQQLQARFFFIVIKIDVYFPLYLSKTRFCFKKAVISLTSGTEYQYQYDNNKTCIMFRAEVLFTLTNGKDEVKLDGTNFTVKGGDCALPNELDASLFLTTSREDYFTLYFKYDEKNQTSMDSMFTFAPYQYFPHSPTPSEYSMYEIHLPSMSFGPRRFQMF